MKSHDPVIVDRFDPELVDVPYCDDQGIEMVKDNKWGEFVRYEDYKKLYDKLNTEK